MLMRSFLPCFFLALTFNITGLVDSMLAGAFFSSEHIAAIGIVASAEMIVSSILLAFVQGTVMFYTTALGRGSRNVINEIFSFGVCSVALTGLLLTLISMTFAGQIVTVFGAKTPELREYASQYLWFNALTYIPNSLAQLIFLILGAYGYQKDMMWANIFSFITNVLCSVAFVKLIPDIGIGALGLGTFVASLVNCLTCVAIVRLRAIRLPLVKVKPSLKKYVSTFAKGSASSVDKFIDGAISAVINGIIVTSALGVNGLAVYAVVKNIRQLLQVAAEGMGYTVTPMAALLYGSKDKNGVIRVLSLAIKLGMILAVAWSLLIWYSLPLLLKIYSGTADISGDIYDIRNGILILLIFLPLSLSLYLLGLFYDATDKSNCCIAVFVIPDSVIFPILAFLLIRFFGYDGLWFAFAGNQALFAVGYYIFYIIRNRKLSIGIEDVIFLKNGMCEKVPTLDVSIRYDDTDICWLSKKIQSYLIAEGSSSRTAYIVALCMDELATDIVQHSRNTQVKNVSKTVMDIKILSNEKRFKILIRNMSKRYNPFDFQTLDDNVSKIGIRTVQKLAYKIRYNYVYQSNIMTINIDKNIDSSIKKQ